MKPHRFVRRLSAAKRRQIEDLFRRARNYRVRRRANAVRLSSMDYTIPQITEVLGCTPQSGRDGRNEGGTGGFIAGLYSDETSIGLEPEWQAAATDEFLRRGVMGG